MYGYLYFITNPSMPGLVKVGHTLNTVEHRISQLNSTGVPAPFHLEASFRVLHPATVEAKIHQLLSEYRYTANREFFAVSLRDAYECAIPLILQFAPSEVGASAETKNRGYLLDEASNRLLQTLAGPGRNEGFTENDLIDSKSEPALNTEVRLAKLLELKLVKQKSANTDWRGTIWFITPKGKKYLADHDLIEQWMLPRNIFDV